MIKIGITGSIASGKTTASKIIALKRGPIFSADKVVSSLYKKKKFKKLVANKLKLKLDRNFKKILRDKLLDDKENLKKLEKIIHPLARKEMFAFINKNKNQPFLFMEIPLLIESKLTKFFDIIFYIKSNKNLRLKRYKKNKNDPKLFKMLDNHQLKDSIKIKFCNHIVVNNESLIILKRKLLNIMKLYE
jgi:dephospho-CoA kinase|tara:strand:+ start:2758 stop:3324 length:567 start_codon:yes stop_codon:yes gene_type:complete